MHYERGEKAEQASESDLQELWKVVSYTMLRKERQFARSYSAKQFKKLCGRRRPDGKPLHWGHVVLLLTISDPEKRSIMEARAADKDWTARELRLAIRAKYKKRWEYGGRNPQFSNFKIRIEQMTQDIHYWVKRCKKSVDRERLQTQLESLRSSCVVASKQIRKR